MRKILIITACESEWFSKCTFFCRPRFLRHSSFRPVETVDVCIVASLSVAELLQPQQWAIHFNWISVSSRAHPRRTHLSPLFVSRETWWELDFLWHFRSPSYLRVIQNDSYNISLPLSPCLQQLICSNFLKYAVPFFLTSIKTEMIYIYSSFVLVQLSTGWSLMIFSCLLCAATFWLNAMLLHNTTCFTIKNLQ